VLVTLTVDASELAYSSSPGPGAVRIRSAAAYAPPDPMVARLTASRTPPALTPLGTVEELNATFSVAEVTYTADGPGTFTLTIAIDDQGAGEGPPEQTIATVFLNTVVEQVTEVPTLGS
jgi:hypothetical protein